MSVSWAELNKKILDNSIIKQIPASGTFELTARCNFQCKMCYVCKLPNDKEAIESELSASQWTDIARQAREAGLLFLVLTGGEIFARKDFSEIYDQLSEMGFNITLFTNGSLITKEKAKWLAKKPPSKVSITLYGASPETYEKVTGHKDSFYKVMDAIRYLKDEGVVVELKTTVIKANSEEFHQISKIARDFGVGLGVVNYVSPRREGIGSEPEFNRLSALEIAKYEKMVEKYNLEQYLNSIGENISKVRINEDIMEDTLLTENKIEEDSAFKCLSGKCGFWITWNGKLSPCGLLDKPYALPLEDGFSKSWKMLKNFCLQVPKSMECINCELKDNCMACPARLMTETGYFDKPAKYLCEMAKHRVQLSTI